MAKAVILGVTGMLGRGVLQAFEGSKVDLVGTARKGANADGLGSLRIENFDAMIDELEVLDNLVSE
ncbi:MAG: hypothetical protein RIQ37_569, partial [Actinomycetota bacterium]